MGPPRNGIPLIALAFDEAPAGNPGGVAGQVLLAPNGAWPRLIN